MCVWEKKIEKKKKGWEKSDWEEAVRYGEDNVEFRLSMQIATNKSLLSTITSHPSIIIIQITL